MVHDPVTASLLVLSTAMAMAMAIAMMYAVVMVPHHQQQHHFGVVGQQVVSLTRLGVHPTKNIPTRGTGEVSKTDSRETWTCFARKFLRRTD